MLVDGGDVVLWGFLVREMGFQCRIALLGGFGLVSLLLRLSSHEQVVISAILITPFLSYIPTAIKTPIILGYNYARLVVRSKPVRLNIYLGLIILVESLLN